MGAKNCYDNGRIEPIDLTLPAGRLHRFEKNEIKK
jgi:hypothetical protein